MTKCLRRRSKVGPDTGPKRCKHKSGSYTRTGLTVSGNRSFGMMTPKLIILVQITINMYGGKERGPAECLQASVKYGEDYGIVWGCIHVKINGIK